MTITNTPSVPCPVVGAADHPRAVATLSAAFHRDPVFEWVYVDPAQRRSAVPHLFSVLVEQFVSRGTSRATPDGDGAALWLPPGEELLSEDTADSVIADVMAGAGPAAERLAECLGLLEANHPHAPHWYLGFLGVIPALQRCGLGSALLRTTLAEVDAAGEPAYLEATSPANRRLYERHGFQVVRELPLPDGPSLYAMWREPRAGGAS
jgi:ribosomal protein S18 acetylase RimI-like enzyme